TSDAARDLHHLNGVRKTASEVVGSAAGKDLGLSGKAAKGSRLNDALAVSLKWSARGPLRGKKNPGCQVIVRILRDCTGTQVRGKDCTLAHTSSLMPAGSPQSVPLRGYLVTFAELSFANLTRAFSSLCWTFCTSSGSASAERELAYSDMARSHCATAIFSLPVFSYTSPR